MTVGEAASLMTDEATEDLFDYMDDEDGGSILGQLGAIDDEEEQEAMEAEESAAKLGIELTGWPSTDKLLEEAGKLRAEHAAAIELGRVSGHKTVLLHSSMQFIFPERLREPGGLFNGTYVDLTFGRGGHTREILKRLSPHARLVAFDIDPTAASVAGELERLESRFTFVPRPFSEVNEVMGEHTVDGIIADIGVSSPQLDDQYRGFSLSNLGSGARPLDLRMNPKSGVPASEWLVGAKVEELAWVLKTYGAGSMPAERIAQAIMDDQKENGPYKTMNRFAEVAAKATLRSRGEHDEAENFVHPLRGLDHPAKPVLAAIRVFINDENEEFEKGLAAGVRSLVLGGRLIVATFKPSEGAILRQFCYDHEEPEPSEAARMPARRLRELYPLAGTTLDFSCKRLCKPMKPSGHEVNQNFRARSGLLWIIEKANRTLKFVKAKPRLERSRFKEPARPPLLGGLPERPTLRCRGDG